MDLDALQAFTRFGYSHIIALALATPRALAIVMVLPVFTRLGLTGLPRQGAAMALAIPLIPYVQAELFQMGHLAPLPYAALIAKEVAVGVLLGTLFSLPFWAIDIAGGLIDFARGATIGGTIDPSSGEEDPITGTILTLMMIALFIAANGMIVVVDGLYGSYDVWPLSQALPHFSAAAGDVLIGMIGDAIMLAFVVSAPIVVLMFLGDLGLGFVTRFAPQLNVFFLSMAVKGAIFVLVMPLYLVLLLEWMRDGLDPLTDVVRQLQLMAAP
jgi:type III secretion protein T